MFASTLFAETAACTQFPAAAFPESFLPVLSACLLFGLAAGTRLVRPGKRESDDGALDASARFVAAALMRIGAEMWEYVHADGTFTVHASSRSDGAKDATTRATREEFLAGLHADDRGAFTHALDDALAGHARSWRLVFRRQQPEGGYSWVEERAVALLAESGDVDRIVAIRLPLEGHRDVTAGQEHHDERLRTFGQLAAGIAHEINTPAQFVGDNLRFLGDAFVDLAAFLREVDAVRSELRRFEGGTSLSERLDRAARDADLEFLHEEFPRALRQAADGIARIAKIVLAVKEFSHPGPNEKQPTDLNRTIESTVTVCRNEWKYVAELTLDLAEDLPQVTCHPGEISQVVLHLVVNAAHAIEERLERDRCEKGRIGIRTRRVDAGHVEIRIADTGCGIPDEIRTRIFERFFTTKAKGRGTGQGLAIARSVIVERHGGTLTFESTVGEGTEFVIQLPIEED